MCGALPMFGGGHFALMFDTDALQLFIFQVA